jgi:hypothetical protein
MKPILLNILSWNNITTLQLSKLTIILILMYIFIFHILSKLPNKIFNYQFICLKKCNHTLCKMCTNTRGSNYFVLSNHLDKNSIPDCILTVWEFSHILFHIYLGYYYNIYISQGLSIGFEIYEKYAFNCESGIDIICNLIGFLIGYTFRIYTN